MPSSQVDTGLTDDFTTLPCLTAEMASTYQAGGNQTVHLAVF